MKELVKYSRVTGYLEKLYRELNQDKFNGELEEPVITIQSTPRCCGHVTVGKVWKIDGQEEQFRYELNIGAGTLDRPIENVVSTLLHEMVHIYHCRTVYKTVPVAVLITIRNLRKKRKASDL